MSRFPLLLLLPILLVPTALLQAGQIGTLQEKPASLDESTEVKGGGTPDIVLRKTVGTDPDVCADGKNVEVPLGSNVYYCFEIENTSALTFDLHDLEDDQLGPILSNFPFQLAPAARVFITAEFVATSDVIGFATWTATDNDTATVARSVDSTTVTISPPLVLTKSVGTDPSVCATGDEVLVAPGTNVYYCFEIENTSALTFNLHTLEDSELGPILTDFPFSLTAGAAVFVTAEHTVFADVVNTATWTGLVEGSGVPFLATDTAVVRVHTPTPTQTPIETPTPTPTSTLPPPTPTATPLPRADLSVLKTDFPDPVRVGEVLAYSVAVENLGPDDATDVRMVDFLPAGTLFLSASPGCNHMGGTVLCEWSTIPSGEVRLATLAVEVLSPVNLCNFVQVRALEIDPDPSNNSVQSCTVGLAPTFHPADVNEDGRVDALDVLELLRAWKMEFE